MGHFCHICKRSRPNEKFSGRGHRIHVCKDCQGLPREKRERIQHLDDLQAFLNQTHISDRNIARLRDLVSHPHPQVQGLAKLVLDIALVHPFKRRRWRHLASGHRELFQRAVETLGLEFFVEVLLDYGDTGGPLWDALEEFAERPSWTAKPCSCGSGLPFRDCCMEREDSSADEAIRGTTVS